MITIILISIGFLIMLYYTVKHHDKVTQKAFYEDIELKILMSESEEELNSNDIFSSMQIFRRDYMYDVPGQEMWIKMNRLWDDAERFFMRRRESDCVLTVS